MNTRYLNIVPLERMPDSSFPRLRDTWRHGGGARVKDFEESKTIIGWLYNSTGGKRVEAARARLWMSLENPKVSPLPRRGQGG
jgi:hypothetical protein